LPPVQVDATGLKNKTLLLSMLESNTFISAINLFLTQ
jgi:hypothetical protein